MRTKNFVLLVFLAVSVSAFLIIFGQQKPATIQNIVASTHQQLQNFKETLVRDAEEKTLMADEAYLTKLGFVEKPRLYPKDIWHNTSLPVIVTYVLKNQESQAIGLINNFSKVFPNNTILIYDLGLGHYGLKTLQNYCNSSKCQVISYSLYEFPSYVEDDSIHAYRPLIIQDALFHVGAILFVECNHRLQKQVTASEISRLYETTVNGSGILTWPLPAKNAVSSRTHKKMFDYFHTEADNFLFVPMVAANVIIIVNNREVHDKVMLPWIQCALTQDCIHPIGAQSGGCRFNKKPQYRYSGCHSYDASALNIVLALTFNLDSGKYSYDGDANFFKIVSLNKARSDLQELELNSTTEGRTQSEPYT